MTESSLPQTRPDDRGSRDWALLGRRAAGYTELVHRRPDLRGVGTFAQDLAEAVRWSA